MTDVSTSRAVAADARSSPWTYVGAGLLFVAFVALFRQWFWTQHLLSLDAIEDWGHAYAIPLIVGYVLWARRSELRDVRIGVFWPGVAPFLLGVVCYVTLFAPSLGNHMLRGVAMVLTLVGAVLTLLGPRVLHLTLLPLGFLVFGITVSEQIMTQITFQLQLLASKGSWVLLSVVGMLLDFSVIVEGNMLTVVEADGTVHPLNVAEACAGMRMVIAFFALAGAVALIGCREWWQRILLVLLAAPVALGMNVIRVAVLGVLTLVDPDLAAGDAHTLIGTLLLFPALALFMGVVWALKRVVRPDEGAV